MDIEHKNLLPLSGSDVIGSGLMFLSLVLASTGGIGGGGILAPILLLIFKFHSNYATALTNVAIFGAACSNFLVNVRLRHPNSSSRFLIDWETAAILEPATMLGAIIGAILSHILPRWLTSPFLIAMLTIMAARYLYLGIVQFKKEGEGFGLEVPSVISRNVSESNDVYSSDKGSNNNSAAESEVAETEVEVQSNPSPVVLDKTRLLGNRRTFPVKSQYGSLDIHVASDEKYDETSTEKKSLLQHQGYSSSTRATNHSVKNSHQRLESFYVPVAEPYRKDALFWLLAMLIGNTIINYWSHEFFPSNYFLLAGIVCVWTLLIFIFARNDVIRARIRRQRNELATTYSITSNQAAEWIPRSSSATSASPTYRRSWRPPSEHSQHSPSSSSYMSVGEIDWKKSYTLIYPAISLFAGVVAGLFGIGGGIIKSPLLLELGMHPQAAAGTSSTMILFTSATALMTYLILGSIIWDYAIFFFVLGMIATALGQALALFFIRTYKRISIITISVGIVILISSIVLIIQTVNPSLQSILIYY